MEEMVYQKYQHIERYGTDEVNGIENGTCYVFPKIDGTNSQLWWSDGLRAGNRNRELTLEADNAGFYNWAVGRGEFGRFFEFHPNLRLYGEWLVPNTLRAYKDNAWRNFYVFDVVDENGAYLPYEQYKILLEEYGINFIPPLCRVYNPTYERLIGLLEENDYLIKDGEGSGEGIVIKNYDWRNKYGRTTWAKIVKSEFKAAHRGKEARVVKEVSLVEERIVEKYVTLSLVEKEKAKIEGEVGEWSSRLIGRLFGVVFYCLVNEECWNFIKEFKMPTVDFKKLNYFCGMRVKYLMPELFL